MAAATGNDAGPKSGPPGSGAEHKTLLGGTQDGPAQR
jgi:hypothetical protein